MECWSNEGFRFKILDLLIDASRNDGFHNLSSAFLNSQLSFGRPPFGRVPICAFRNPKLIPSALCSLLYAFFLSNRCFTALTRNGQATVASQRTSAKRPPSSGATNLPQETPSE
jgi:hypothetical protein